MFYAPYAGGEAVGFASTVGHVQGAVFGRSSRMIKYHGTPISPRSVLNSVAGGNHFCISFNDKRDAEFCVEHAQSVMFDCGAFSYFRKGLPYDPAPYVAWVGQYLYHPHWAIVPDLAFDGDLDKQRDFEGTWPHPPEFSAGVFHQGEPLDRLRELCDKYGRVAIGGNPQEPPGSPPWTAWIDSVFDLCECMNSRPRIHNSSRAQRENCILRHVLSVGKKGRML